MTTRRLSKTVLAALAAGLFAQAPLARPAAAGGQVSWTYAPADRDAARALKAGLQLYTLSQDLRGAAIRQRGQNNRAGIAQSGRGNLGLIEQRGEGHVGSLEQRGGRDAYGLFQFGRNTEDRIVQDGGGSGATVSFGW